MKKERKVWVDITKGVAMIMIMYSHVGGIPNMERYLFAPFIVVYFFLAGYMYQPVSDEERWARLKRKISRLLFPYISFTCLLFFLYKYFCPGKSIGEYAVTLLGALYSRAAIYYPYYQDNQIYCFLMWNGTMWFLTAMAVAYIMFYIIEKWCFKNNIHFTITLLGCFLLTCIMQEIPYLLPWSIDTSFLLLSFIVIGYKVKQIVELEYLFKRDYAVLLGPGFVFYVFLVDLNPDINLSIRQYGNHGIISVALVMVIGCMGVWLYCATGIFLQTTCISKILSCIGRHTMPMIGLQFFLFERLDAAANSFFSGIVQYPMLWETCKIAVTIIICIFLDGFWITRKHKAFALQS